MSDIVEVKPDGREMRSAANRTKLVEAGLRLIERDANWRPSAPQIAAEANVSLRTFFNHFTTSEYFREVLVKDYAEALTTYAGRYANPMDLVKALMK